MKKPLLRIKGMGDYLKIAVCLAMCILALGLFREKEKAVAVFSADDNAAHQSFYGYLGSCI